MEKIRVAQYGCGKIGRLLVKYAMNKGCEIVCAVDEDVSLLGTDIGGIMGMRSLGVDVVSPYDAERVLAESHPDILLIATQSNLSDVEEIYRLSIKLGINAISTGEEAAFPWNSNPSLAQSLDRAAKKAHCTISASGYTDFAWGTMVSSMAGFGVSLKEIQGYSRFSVEDYGKALAEGHGIGLSAEEFYAKFGFLNDLSSKEVERLIKNGTFSPAYSWNQCGWLGKKMDLRIISQKQIFTPYFAKEEINALSLGMTIKPNHVMGMLGHSVAETAEGVIISIESLGLLSHLGEADENSWYFKGEPHMNFSMNMPQTPELTAAGVVARIPQVLKAYPGYLTTDGMEDPGYTPLPFMKV